MDKTVKGGYKMGHVINYNVIPVNANKKAFKAGMDEQAWHDHWEESSQGLPGDIRWIDHVCENEEKAREYIDSHDKGWYDQLAVKFKKADYSGNKQLEKLGETRRNMFIKLNALENKPHFKDAKSSLISCKCCGSKIANKYMQRKNYCPVCQEDMRPDTVKLRIEAYKEKLAEIDKKITALKQKLDEKGELFWLIKTEYHS